MVRIFPDLADSYLDICGPKFHMFTYSCIDSRSAMGLIRVFETGADESVRI